MVEMEKPQYVRAIYNFAEPHEGEIHLNVGDVIRVTGKINADWLSGINLARKNQSGNFPSNHVVPLVMPSILDDQKIYIATKTFRTGVDGDLTFVKGDVICGIIAVDENWWHGEHNHSFGIFPMTHVVELGVESTSSLSSKGTNSESHAEKRLNEKSQSIDLHEAQVKKTSDFPANFNEMAAATVDVDIRQKNTVGINVKPAIAHVRATLSLAAQLPEELNFVKGDMIDVLEILDEDFAIGRCADGSVGQFPLAFVEVVDGSINRDKNETEANTKRLSKFEWWKDPAVEESLKRSSGLSIQSQPSFEQQTAPLEDYNTKSSSVVDEALNEQVETWDDKNPQLDAGSSTRLLETTETAPSQRQLLARTLFPFVAENINELSFGENVIVTLVGQVDDQWTEGIYGGARGIFPSSYVEMIVDKELEKIVSNHDASPLHAWPTISTEVLVDMKLSSPSDQNVVDMNKINLHQAPDTVFHGSETSTVNCDGLDEFILGTANSGVIPHVDDTRKNHDIQVDSGNCSSVCEQTEFLAIDNIGYVSSTELDMFNGDCGVQTDKLNNDEASRTEGIDVSNHSEECVDAITEDHCVGEPVRDIECDTNKCPVSDRADIVAEPHVQDLELSGKNVRPTQLGIGFKNAIDILSSHAVDHVVLSSTSVKSPISSPSSPLARFGQKPAITRPKPSLKPKPSLDVHDKSPEISTFVLSAESGELSPDQKLASAAVNREIHTTVNIQHNLKGKPNDPLMNSVISELTSELKSVEDNSDKMKALPPRPNRPSLRKQKCADIPGSKSVDQLSSNYVNLESTKNARDGLSLNLESNINVSRDSNTNNGQQLYDSDAIIMNSKSAAATGNTSKKASRSVSFVIAGEGLTRPGDVVDTSTPSTPAHNLPPPVKPKPLGPKPTTPVPGLDGKQESHQVGQSLFYVARLQDDDEGRNSLPPAQVHGSVAPVQSAETGRQSTFYTSVDDEPSYHVTVSDKKVPPRPSRPRVSTTGSGCHFGGGTNFHDSNVKLVPCRPAPPRPNMLKNIPSSNTCNFLVSSGSFEEENREVVEDIQRRINELEGDLKKCRQLKNDLKLQLKQASEEERADILSSLEFYKANVAGLSDELKQQKESFRQLRPDIAAVERSLLEESRRRAAQEEEERRQAQLREEQRARQRDTRERVIEELLQTENDYLQSLCLCLETFFSADADKVPACVDMETLFGNIYEVVELSQKFISIFEMNTAGKGFEEQIIGICFEELKEPLKHVYSIYCRNHNDVLALLEKYEAIPEAQDYFASAVEGMRSQASVFDLGSILIKPVQRILKYPLLLNELLKDTFLPLFAWTMQRTEKATEQSHVDYSHLVAAINAMKDVATAINEIKRRKDLVLKYKNVSQMSVTEMLSRVNIHSTRKKFSRMSMKMAGIHTADEHFTREENKFRSLVSNIPRLIQGITRYLEALQDSLRDNEVLANDIEDLYGDSHAHQIHGFCQVCSRLANSTFAAFKGQVDVEVLRPLNSLVLMFRGPDKIIKKRGDKLLDYDSATIKLKGNRDSDQTKVLQDEVRLCKVTYEALNAQLLEDLPRFHTLTTLIVSDCLRYFLRIQTDFQLACCQEVNVLSQMEIVSRGVDGHELSGIIESFNSAHAEAVDRLSDLSFIPKSFNPLAEVILNERRERSFKSRRSVEIGSSHLNSEMPETGAQTAAIKNLLQQTYSANKLHVLTQDFNGSQLLDLALSKGTIVALVKEGDPMGNKNRLFVDNGSSKGFVLKSYLTLYIPEIQEEDEEELDGSGQPDSLNSAVNLSKTFDQSDSYNSSVSSSANSSPLSSRASISSRPSFETCDDSHVTLSIDGGTWKQESPNKRTLNKVDKDYNVYQARYSYSAGSDIEIDLNADELVCVLQKHDLTGNCDWWLVSSGSKQGYIPASYLELHTSSTA